MAITRDLQNRRLNWAIRLSTIIGIGVLHYVCYYMVNLINSLRQSSVFFNFSTVVDNWIPYFGWSWVFYYFGDVYVSLGAAIIVWRLSDKMFVRALYVYIGMIITGALIQLTLPGKAPWPNELIGAQHFVHNLISMRPYACLPSMRVALTVFPTCIIFSVTKSKLIRILSTLTAILITFSTLTMKEHFFLDTLTGLILGLSFYAIWRRALKFSRGNPK